MASPAVDATGAPAIRATPPTDASRPPSLTRRVLLAPWLAPMALMAVLGWWDLGRPALWADELATANAAALSWADLRQLLGTVDLVLAPYYVLMHAWVSVAGQSEVALRLPSLFAMVGAVGCTAALGARLRDARTGLLAGLLLAITPTASRFAQESRPYAFTILFAVVATLFLVRAMERPTGLRFVAYAIALALLSMVHPTAALLVVAHAAAAWRRDWWPRWLAAAAVGVLPAVALVSLAWLDHQYGQVSWIGLTTWTAAADTPARLAGSAAVGGALLVLGMVAASRRGEVPLLVAWAVLPTALLLLAGYFTPIWVYRYVLITLPAWALLGAFALRRLSLVTSVAIVALITGLGMTSQSAFRRTDGHGQASRQVSAIIGPLYRPGDVAVYADNHPSIPWAPRDVVQRYLPADRTPQDALALTPQRTDGELLAEECPDPAACLANASRVWLIRVDNPPDPLSALEAPKEQILRDRYRVQRTWRRPLLTIVLLVPKPPLTPPG